MAGFWLDATEVSNAQYREYLRATLWKPLLPALVFSQTLFYEAYADSDFKPIRHGRPLRPRLPTPNVDMERLRSRRQKFLQDNLKSPADLQQVWTGNARSYVRF